MKGLRDDTTCIVIDVHPPEKPNPPLPPPKKQGKGVFTSMFRKKSTESSNDPQQPEKEFCEPDVVEELFEEGSAMLSERFVQTKSQVLAKLELTLLELGNVVNVHLICVGWCLSNLLCYKKCF